MAVLWRVLRALKLIEEAWQAPRALRDARVKVEDEFVAPRPALTLSDVVPSATDVPLEKLWVEPASMAPGSAGRGEVAPLLDEEKRARAMESAAKLLSCPGRATEEDVERWRALAECDWREALQQAQEGEDQAGESEGSHGCGSLRLPSAADLCLAIECCRSEALAQFVWEDLLEPLVDRAVFGSSEPKQSSDSSSLERHAGEPTPLTGVRRLLAAVVRHSSFARMEPRRFRALVRARNLRQVDEVVGAQLELELVALFQRQRQLQQLQPQRQVAGSCHHGDAETARMSLGECHCAEGTCSSAASPPSRSSWRRGAAR